MKCLVFLTFLALLATVAADDTVKCRDDSWLKVENRKDKQDLCYKTFFLDHDLNFKEAQQWCEGLRGYGAPYLDDTDGDAILESVKDALKTQNGQKLSKDSLVEIFLGGQKVQGENVVRVAFNWTIGTDIVEYNDIRWGKNGERGQPEGNIGSYSQNCLSYYYNTNGTVNKMALQDTVCECPNNKIEECRLQRRGVTCVTRPAIVLFKEWTKMECNHKSYCEEILKILLDWFLRVQAKQSLDLRNYIEEVYVADAKYTFTVTENETLTENQQQKDISVLFLDHIQGKTQNNIDPITVTPLKVTQNDAENYFDAVWDFDGGKGFSAQLLTRFNENLLIVSQTFAVRRAETAARKDATAVNEATTTAPVLIKEKAVV